MYRFFRGIRSKFFIIYLLFGLLPLLTISYLSFSRAASILERLSDHQLSNLTEKTAEQTRRQFLEIRKDIDLLAGYPFIQLSFLQFNFGQRLETVSYKINRYKNQHEIYARISLISPEGNIILTVPEESGQTAINIEPARLRAALEADFYSSGVLLGHPEGPLMIFSRKVYDFEDASQPVGLLIFYVRLSSMTRFADELAPLPDTSGFVYDHSLGRMLGKADSLQLTFPEIPPGENIGKVTAEEVENLRIFSAPVPELNWTMGLLVPREALLGDILRLRRESLYLVLSLASLALVTTFLIVRRITKPIAQLTLGAQEFSTGNLDHRIDIKGEGELRRLGEEFNAMASQLKARERQLRQVDRLAALGILAAGVAHEVRNPLAGIKSCAQLMQRKAIAPEVGILAQGINEEIERLDKIVRDLLEFAKPGEARPASVSLQQQMEKVLEMVRQFLQDDRISVACHFSHTENVWVDPDQIRQVFLNLILNSAQAMKNGGRLDISLSQDGERITLRVADTGCGIPKEHLERIFDPFFTLQPGGTGLGLSVVHSLMMENAIEWDVESEPGVGTVFTLHFSPINGKGTASGFDSDH